MFFVYRIALRTFLFSVGLFAEAIRSTIAGIWSALTIEAPLTELASLSRKEADLPEPLLPSLPGFFGAVVFGMATERGR
jgi:hypothetical protein